VRAGTAALPSANQPLPAATAPTNNQTGEGLGVAGGIAARASPAVRAQGKSPPSIASPAANSSGIGTGGVAGAATVNPNTAIAPPAKPMPRTAVVPPPTPQPVQPAVPSSGTVIWSGHIDKNALITIQGDSPSSGRLEGQLPGVPVMIQIHPKDIGVAEFPGPENGWKKVVLRGNKSRDVVVRIQWQTLQQ
jgi:hypothetical protein